MQAGLASAAAAAVRTAAAARRLIRSAEDRGQEALFHFTKEKMCQVANRTNNNICVGARAAGFTGLFPCFPTTLTTTAAAAVPRSLLLQQLYSRAWLSSSSSSSGASTARDPGLLVTKSAPDFTADAVLPNGELGKVSLSEYQKKGKGVVLLFYPLDFTFVCPSELLAFHHAVPEFDKLGFQVLGVSVDSVYTHLAWTRTSPAEGGVGTLSFPLLSDLKREISSSFDVLLSGAGVALRGLFIIDKEGIIKHSTVNDLPLGRSVEEALRVCEMIEALEQQKSEAGGSLLQQVCPANWRRGHKMMRASYEGVKEYLSEKEKEIKQKIAEKL